ncbi:MAG: bifunctional shikimate kinase/3-dehydroquinate synthase [Candidatus Limnocylindrus sp.]
MRTRRSNLALVGLPGVGKSSLGRRLAAQLNVPLLDLDRSVIASTGVAKDSVEGIFAREGEAGFRIRERSAVAALGEVTPPAGGAAAALGIGRIVALGGGTLVDPRNRWMISQCARILWLDAPDAVIAGRLRTARVVRPLMKRGNPEETLRTLRAERSRFYAIGARLESKKSPGTLAAPAIDLLQNSPRGSGRHLLSAALPSGQWDLGVGIATESLLRVLRTRNARRVVLVSEPNAERAIGATIAAALKRAKISVTPLTLKSGESAKQLTVIDDAARTLAAAGIERGDLIVAVGGGALTDTAGLLAALYLRGIDWVAVPTTLAAQLDASLGGKTGVDLPEGKNLVGAFHQPIAVIADLDALRSLPTREIVAAMGEAVKIALLGEDRLFTLLEECATRIAAGDPSLHEDGTYAEIVERAGWWKCTVVAGDEREAGLRMSLNLGHTLGHALEQAANYKGILHGEAVGYGLRAALAIGQALGVTPAARASRALALLDTLGLGVAPRRESPTALVEAATRDKKVAGGKIRWVLATEGAFKIRDDVPASLVLRAATQMLAGSGGKR